MKLCKDCLHFVNADTQNKSYSVTYCGRITSINPVDGSERINWRTLPEYRDIGECSIDAIFFTPKDENK